MGQLIGGRADLAFDGVGILRIGRAGIDLFAHGQQKGLDRAGRLARSKALRPKRRWQGVGGKDGLHTSLVDIGMFQRQIIQPRLQPALAASARAAVFAA